MEGVGRTCDTTAVDEVWGAVVRPLGECRAAGDPG